MESRYKYTKSRKKFPKRIDYDAMIKVIDLSKEYHMGLVKVRALDNVSLEVKRGEFVSIMGPSGSGKSTLLNLIGALDNPSSGAVYIGGVNVARMKDEERTNLRLEKIGFVFQMNNLVPVLTAIENVELPLIFMGYSRRQRINRSKELLSMVGLGERLKHIPAELSGGEQQRVAIARALANDPGIVIADEPTGNLDTKRGIEIMNLMRSLNKQLNQTILMVTHDPDMGRFAQRHLRMRDGRIVSEDYVDYY